MSELASITVECPPEVLIELHVSHDQLASMLKETAATALFREGRLSSGLAAKWAGQARIPFLFKAMNQGARLLDQGDADFRRETSLL